MGSNGSHNEATDVGIRTCKTSEQLFSLLATRARVDVGADGIVEALTVMGVSVPVVVRLEGNSAEKGLKILDECELNIIPASNLEEAASLAVKASKGAI